MQLTRRAVLGAGAAASGARSPPAAHSRQATQALHLTALLDRVSIEILRESPERCTGLGVTEEQAGGRFIDRMGDDPSKAASRYQRHPRNRAHRSRRASTASRSPPRDAGHATTWCARRSKTPSPASASKSAAARAAPYVVTQLTGAYTDVPDFLDSQHPAAHARRGRSLSRAPRRIRRASWIRKRRSSARTPPPACIPPDFAHRQAPPMQLRPVRGERAGANCAGAIAGAPLAGCRGDSGSRSRGLTSPAPKPAVRDEVLPAYQRQIEALQRVRARRRCTTPACWRLPRGEEMYAAALRNRTTTDMTPDEIHDMGLELIAQFQRRNGRNPARRRHDARQRRRSASQQISRRPDQLYPNNDAGRAQCWPTSTRRSRPSPR